MRAAPQNRISERALPVWKLSAGITSAIGWLLVIGAFILHFIFDWSLWIPVGLLILSVIETIVSVFVLPKVKWRRWRYEVHEQEIDIQHGLFIIHRTLIPMIRVQHVDTRQGPLLRAYNLATVTISTAATVHEIPALDLQEADELRDYISKLARVDDEDV